MTTKRHALVAFLAGVACWPLAHRVLVARYGIDPWKLGAFAMYATPNLPVLVMLGSDEGVVSAAVIRAQLAQMAQGELLALPGARHEIFMERPEVLAEVWRRIDAFLAAVPRRGLAAVS